MSERIEVRFFTGDVWHAQRSLHHVPRVGDVVRLNDGVYRLTKCAWHFDGEPMVAFDMELVERWEGWDHGDE